MEATVGFGGEVTAVAAFAVEADESAAVRALAYPVPEVGGVHAFNVGAAKCGGVTRLDHRAMSKREAFGSPLRAPLRTTTLIERGRLPGPSLNSCVVRPTGLHQC